MATSLFPPPVNDTADRPPRGPDRPEPPEDRPPGRRPPGRRTVVAAIAAAALLGGVAGGGVVAVTGGDAGADSTVVQPDARGSDTSSAALNSSAVFASVSPGVVEIAASGVSSRSPARSARAPRPRPRPGPVRDRRQGLHRHRRPRRRRREHGQGHLLRRHHPHRDGNGKDDATDVAVLKVDPSGLNLHPLKLGSSASLGVGDALAAIGSPFGYEESLSTGIVSGLDRTIQAPNGFTVSHAVQTDAAMNPGNSGGPIVDSAAASSASPTRSRPTAPPSRAPASASRSRSTSSSARSPTSRPAGP